MPIVDDFLDPSDVSYECYMNMIMGLHAELLLMFCTCCSEPAALYVCVCVCVCLCVYTVLCRRHKVSKLHTIARNLVHPAQLQKVTKLFSCNN